MSDRPEPAGRPMGGVSQRPAVGIPSDRPASVRIAIVLWRLAIGTGLAGEVIGLCLARRVAAQAVAALDPGDTNPMLSPALVGPSPSGAVFDLVLFAVLLAVLTALRDGAHWSRATLTALGALTVLDRVCTTGLAGWLYLRLGSGGRVDLALGVVNVLAVLGAVLAMYTASTSRYLRRA